MALKSCLKNHKSKKWINGKNWGNNKFQHAMNCPFKNSLRIFQARINFFLKRIQRYSHCFKIESARNLNSKQYC